LVNKIVYDFRAPARGEIVVFKAPAGWRRVISGFVLRLPLRQRRLSPG
jgi:hypothetical protein